MKGWSIREGDQLKVEIGSFKTREISQSQLADEILFGKLKKGGKVTISLDKNEVVIASEKCIS